MLSERHISRQICRYNGDRNKEMISHPWVVLRKGAPRGVTMFETVLLILLSIKNSNVDDFHVSIAINI